MRIIKDNYNKNYNNNTIKKITKYSDYFEEDFTYGVLEVVELRNGTRAFVFGDRILTKKGYIMLTNYNGNNHERNSDYDIVGRKEIKSTHFTNMKKLIDCLYYEIM